MTDTMNADTDTVVGVLLLGGDDVAQFGASKGDGGRATPDLATLIAQHDGYTAAIEYRPVDTLEGLAASVRADGAPAGGVVVASVSTAMAQAPDVDDVEAWFLEVGADLVQACREQDTHLIIANGSTFDPSDKTHTYRGVDDPPALTVQRLDLAVIQLSVLDGISIIDADRIAAELGAEQAVESLFSYRASAASALCAELHRIMEEYRFFDSAPLVAQQGRRKD